MLRFIWNYKINFSFFVKKIFCIKLKSKDVKLIKIDRILFSIIRSDLTRKPLIYSLHFMEISWNGAYKSTTNNCGVTEK